MPRKIRELRADAGRAGFNHLLGKGSHTKWKHPLVPGTLVISGGDGNDARPYQERQLKEWLEKAHQAEQQQKKGQQP